MNLNSIQIQNFRSIDNLVLPECGPLNVLIGRNNSGKSNILSAINSLYECVKNKKVANLEAPLGGEIDFHRHRTDTPITLLFEFSMDKQEAGTLLSNIRDEAPQLSNAIDALDRDLSLRVELAITRYAGHHLSFTKSMSLVVNGPQARRPTERTLFKMDQPAAFELAERMANTASLAEKARDYKMARARIIESTWRRVHDREGRVNYYSPGLSEISPANARAIEELIRESESFAGYAQLVDQEVIRLREEITGLEDQPIEHKVTTFAGEEERIPGYVSALIELLAGVKVLHLREQRKPIGREEASRLLNLKVRRGGSQALRAIQNTVSALLGVQIDAFSSDSPGHSPEEINAEMDVDDFLVQVNGSGIREALRLILDFEFERPDILLVEEPEVHLHPGLETAVMQYLKTVSGTSQVFLTTHSTNFLDTAQMRNVYLVGKAESGTTIQLLDLEDAETRLPSELGLRLSSLFMYDRLVFLEGPTDEAILREWAAKLGLNLTRPNVGFVIMGGVRNYAHYAAAAIMNFLSKRQVDCWFILDRDERDDDEIRRLTAQLDDKGHLIVLKARQIENYLASDGALCEFINWKLQQASNSSSIPVSESQVRDALEQTIDGLQEVSINRYAENSICTPVRFNKDKLRDDPSRFTDAVVEEFNETIAELTKRRNEVEGIVSKCKSDLGLRWGKEKVNLVPGELLLDRVCQTFGVRFFKERDGSRLAAMMHPDQIPTEIAKTLRQIAGQ